MSSSSIFFTAVGKISKGLSITAGVFDSCKKTKQIKTVLKYCCRAAEVMINLALDDDIYDLKQTMI
jgi:hypothetical protein